MEDANHFYLLIGLFLSLFVDMHVPFQIDCIDKLLWTQVTRDHWFSCVQQPMGFQVISPCECWTTVFTYKFLIIPVSCHVPLKVCTFNKGTITLCALVASVPWSGKKLTWKIGFNLYIALCTWDQTCNPVKMLECHSFKQIQQTETETKGKQGSHIGSGKVCTSLWC